MHISLVENHPQEQQQPAPLRAAFALILRDARSQSNRYLEDCLVPEGGE